MARRRSGLTDLVHMRQACQYRLAFAALVLTGGSLGDVRVHQGPASAAAANVALTGSAAYGYDGGSPQTMSQTLTVKAEPSVKINEIRTAVRPAESLWQAGT